MVVLFPPAIDFQIAYSRQGTRAFLQRLFNACIALVTFLQLSEHSDTCVYFLSLPPSHVLCEGRDHVNFVYLYIPRV